MTGFPFRSALALLAGLALLALFPLPFWFGIGVMHWNARWQVGLMALVAAGIALAAVFVVVRLNRLLAPLPPGAAPRITRAEMAALHAEDLARIEADPALRHWLPLARRMARFDQGALARYEARYRELMAQPGRQLYAQRLLAGEWLGDREIDYLEHPERLVTCEHLQPIERDLRRHGIRGIPGEHMDLWSAAWLELRDLRQRYALPESVREIQGEDHPHSPGSVFIRCDACGSSIESGGGERLPATGTHA